jgi:hypothetical protein
MRKRTLAAATAALIIAAGCGMGSETTVTEDGDTPATATSTPAKKAAAKPGKVGTTYTVSVDGSTVAWKLLKVETKTADKYGQKPSGGGKWVLAQMQATAKEGQDANVWTGQTAIVSTTGTVHDPDIAGIFPDREGFSGTSLSAGQTTTGWVIFSIPAKDLPGAKLQLKELSILDENGVATWDLGLKK